MMITWKNDAITAITWKNIHDDYLKKNVEVVENEYYLESFGNKLKKQKKYFFQKK